MASPFGRYGEAGRLLLAGTLASAVRKTFQDDRFLRVLTRNRCDVINLPAHVDIMVSEIRSP
jgi:uncharacterized protein YprB with RNaseH-like and TPR domain